MNRPRALLIAYDIRDPRRLRRVARCLETWATRVQNSVFLACLDAPALSRLREELRERIDESTDLLRLYPLHPSSTLYYLGQPPLRSGLWLSSHPPIAPFPLALSTAPD